MYPPKTPAQILTEYLNEFADLKGTVFYPREKDNGIKHCTGTRVYQVSKLHQHLPRMIQNMFSKTILCIYDEKPTEKPTSQEIKYYDTENYSDNDIYYSDTTHSETENETRNIGKTKQQ